MPRLLPVTGLLVWRLAAQAFLSFPCCETTMTRSGMCRTQAGEDGEEQPDFLPMFPWYSGKPAYPLTLQRTTEHIQVDNVGP